MATTSDLRFPGRSEMLGTLAAASEVDVPALLTRLKGDVFRGRVRLSEFFKDFDTLRSGKVTEAKFRTALDESGLKLNDPELTELSRYFADPSDPKRVSYEGLLAEIESVFTTPGMESDPSATVADYTPQVRGASLEWPQIHAWRARAPRVAARLRGALTVCVLMHARSSRARSPCSPSRTTPPATSSSPGSPTRSKCASCCCAPRSTTTTAT